MSEKTNKALYIVLSLLTAVLFWLYVDNVQGNTITKEFRNVPVDFVGAEDTLPSRGLMLAGETDVTVDLVLGGARTVISDLRAEDIGLQVDLTNITGVGRYTRTLSLITPENVSRSSISIEKTSLSTITVQVSEMFEKTVPVEVAVTGKVAEGYIYMAEKLVAQPSSVTLTGREEDVDQVDHVQVVVDLSGASSTVSREFSYQFLDAGDNPVEPENIRVSDKRIMVNAPVYIIKTLPLTVKLVESAGSRLENVDWSLEVTSIDVAGEAANLETKEDILLGTVDLSLLLSDTDIILDINEPAGCVNLSGITSTRLSIHFKDDLATKAFSVTNITPIGLADGLSFSRVTSSVDVVVRGPAEDLELLTAEDIRIVVDLSQYTSATTTSVTATVLVDGYDQVGAVGTYSVAFRITSS